MVGRPAPGRRPGICMIGSHAAPHHRYPSVSEDLARRFERDGFRVLLASRHRRRVPKLADMVGTLLRHRREYDVVCIDTYSTTALWYARISARVARLLGKRVVLVLHGGRLPELCADRPGSLRGLLARADRVVAPSAFLAREVGERMSVPVEVIANPVPCALYPSRLRARARPRLFWLRAFRKEYRPEVAVRAAALLAPRYGDLHLVMAGPERDGSFARCRALARELGIADRIEFPGLISKREIRRLGDAADVFLNTTSVDNTPVSVLEAMAMGLCIVSTRVGGIPDLIEEGRSGQLVPPDDAVAVACAVASIVELPARARRLSAGALRAARSFDLETVVPRWYRLFRGLREGGVR